MSIRRTALAYGVLRAPAGDGEGGGDGGKGGGTEGAGKGITEEDVGRIVNAAITAHNKRNEAAQKTAIQTAVTEGLKGIPWKDVLTPVLSELRGGGEGGGKGAPAGGDKGGAGGTEKDPQLHALERTVKDLSDKLEKSEKARTDGDVERARIEQARRFDGGVQQLQSLLKGKLHELYADDAIDRWTKIDERLKVDENGVATLRVKRAAFKGAPELDEELPLAEAVPILLSHKDAEKYLPAPDAGKGTNRSKGPQGAGHGGTGSTTGDDPMSKTLNALEKLGVDPNDLLS